MLLTIALAVTIGMLLGLLGGGGSILTVPMLVYLLHIEPKAAIVTSFVVVGVSSLIAIVPHARRGHVCWKNALFFGASGMAGAYCGGRLAVHFSNAMLMALFGVITLLTGLAMVLKRQGKTETATETQDAGPQLMCSMQTPYLRLLFDGFFAGGLTGMVGVGGGFLIVPVLTMLVGLPMPAAIGTSLMIIVMNAVAGLLGYSNHVAVDVELTVIVTACTVVGSVLGSVLSNYISASLLRKSFGWFVVLVAVYVLSNAVTLELWEVVKRQFVGERNLINVFMGVSAVLALVLVGSWIHHTTTAKFK
ncbi:MAG: hypothetical protein CTY29_07595 [Methylobacter sp.]|nr:MAG: hypothetical protein CTY29_07595 [Methylobacter sp.]